MNRLIDIKTYCLFQNSWTEHPVTFLVYVMLTMYTFEQYIDLRSLWGPTTLPWLMALFHKYPELKAEMSQTAEFTVHNKSLYIY